MDTTRDSIKTLASRFVSLPDYLRVKITRRLLIWLDQNQAAGGRGRLVNGQRRKSLLEQFWDEVEKTHGDGLHRCNPFA